jgi:hypothetical protein
MLNGQVRELLVNPVQENAKTFIVYSSCLSERLSYACHFIFNTVLRVNYILSSDLTEFQKSKHYKINYSSEELSGSIQIIPHPLLFENEISKLKPNVLVKDEMIYFFETFADSKKNTFHFDLFSAVFYFVSRYEEWQVFECDKHQRFEAHSSLLFQNNFHLKPVVDLWILEFKVFLQSAYPELQLPEPQFKIISTLDIDNLYAYKNKGIIRTFAATAKDLTRLDFKNIIQRTNVLLRNIKDPFDVYDEVAKFCSDQNVPLICFFLLRTGKTFDRTVNPRSLAFKKVMTILRNHGALLGLHPSYDSAFDKSLLREECQLFSEKSGDEVQLSRQHFLRFDIRSTPQLLIERGIQVDCTMGYASSPGFRAGTSYPFHYFDFSKEQAAELLFLPFCAMDGAYYIYDRKNPEDTLNSLYSIAEEIKNTGGFFITVFHERSFSNHLYPGFGSLYKRMHLRLKEL